MASASLRPDCNESISPSSRAAPWLACLGSGTGLGVGLVGRVPPLGGVPARARPSAPRPLTRAPEPAGRARHRPVGGAASPPTTGTRARATARRACLQTGSTTAAWATAPLCYAQTLIRAATPSAEDGASSPRRAPARGQGFSRSPSTTQAGGWASPSSGCAAASAAPSAPTTDTTMFGRRYAFGEVASPSALHFVASNLASRLATIYTPPLLSGEEAPRTRHADAPAASRVPAGGGGQRRGLPVGWHGAAHAGHETRRAAPSHPHAGGRGAGAGGGRRRGRHDERGREVGEQTGAGGGRTGRSPRAGAGRGRGRPGGARLRGATGHARVAGAARPLSLRVRVGG